MTDILVGLGATVLAALMLTWALVSIVRAVDRGWYR